MFILTYVKEPNSVLYIVDYSHNICIFSSCRNQAKVYQNRDSALIDSEQISFLFGLDVSIKKLEA